MTTADANNITRYLKETCDPRGHDLVDAIGELLRSLAEALEAIEKEARPERPAPVPDLRSPW